MLSLFKTNALQRTLYWFAALVLILASTIPLFISNSAGAGTITNRKVTVSTSQADVTGVTYSFAFNTVTDNDIQSMSFQFCNTPLGTCVLPGTDSTPTATETMDVSHVTAAAGAFTGTSATAFTEYTGADAGGCTESDGGSGVATQYCVTRTETTNEAIGAKTFVVNSITNPIIAQTPTAKNNEQIYVRIVTYSDIAFATAVDDGIVAASVVNQLTVTGRVQERLVFCAFALDDAAGSSATVGDASTNFPTRCGSNEAMASSSIDIGVVDNTAIARTPVDNSPPTSLGNDRFGAAMINTNASGGVALTYFATTASSGTLELNAFRVAGATCIAGGADLTDQCFVSADDAAGETLAAGTERFGMQIVCITNSDTTTAGTTKNLGAGGVGAASNQFNAVYANGDTTQDQLEDTIATDNCENTEAGNLVGWRDSTTAQTLIGSSNVVDDEVVKMRFAAAGAATTPTGTYTVATTYIATPTF